MSSGRGAGFRPPAAPGCRRRTLRRPTPLRPPGQRSRLRAPYRVRHAESYAYVLLLKVLEVGRGWRRLVEVATFTTLHDPRPSSTDCFSKPPIIPQRHTSHHAIDNGRGSSLAAGANRPGSPGADCDVDPGNLCADRRHGAVRIEILELQTVAGEDGPNERLHRLPGRLKAHIPGRVPRRPIQLVGDRLPPTDRSTQRDRSGKVGAEAQQVDVQEQSLAIRAVIAVLPVGRRRDRGGRPEVIEARVLVAVVIDQDLVLRVVDRTRAEEQRLARRSTADDHRDRTERTAQYGC